MGLPMPANGADECHTRHCDGRLDDEGWDSTEHRRDGKGEDDADRRREHEGREVAEHGARRDELGCRAPCEQGAENSEGVGDDGEDEE